MKKMKFFAMAFAAIVAVAFSACKPQNEPNNPDDGGDGDKTPTQVEVTLQGAYVQVTGEANPETEAYEVYFKSPEGTIYSSLFLSYYNNENGLIDGTYTISATVNKVETVAFTKVIDANTEVQAESGSIVIKTNNGETEVTITASYPDGDTEKLHYKGAITYEKIDLQGYLEPTEKTTLTIVGDTALGYCEAIPESKIALCQLVIAQATQTSYTEVQLLGWFGGANNSSNEIPVGTFPIEYISDANIANDIFIATNYYEYRQTQGIGSIILVETKDGQNIYWPQTGSITIEKEGDIYNVTGTLTSYYGSTINFSHNGVIAPFPESSGAPQKLAPRIEKDWSRSLIKTTFPRIIKK